MNSLEKKVIKKDLMSLIKEFKIAQAIYNLSEYKEHQESLDFAYKILLNQIPKKVRLKSVQIQYLENLEKEYRSLKQ